jgi:hypothetical protein
MPKVVVLDKRGDKMTKEELLVKLTDIEIGLADNYNHLPHDSFTRDKVATAIDSLIKLISDVALGKLED